MLDLEGRAMWYLKGLRLRVVYVVIRRKGRKEGDVTKTVWATGLLLVRGALVPTLILALSPECSADDTKVYQPCCNRDSRSSQCCFR